jgi:transposase
VMLVDFAGRTAEVIDVNTVGLQPTGLTRGEIVPVRIFAAVPGAASFTCAQAVWSRKLPDWIAAHVHAFAYFGGAALQRAAPADPPGSRGTDHRRHGRDLPSRQAGRQPSPQFPATSADHCRRAHAEFAPGTYDWRHRDWTHERIRREAAAVGDNTAILADVILRSRPHPEQGFRSCIGILGLVKRYGAVRVEAACARALALAPTARSPQF